jgi:hypothetical protein
LRPKRPGNVANLNRLRRLASKRHGRSAEASREAEAKRGCPQHRVPPDIANHSNDVGGVGLGLRETCQACAYHWQLRRWLRDKLQDRQLPLGRVQRVRLASAVVNMQKRRQLQILPRVQGERNAGRLESH